MKTSMSQLILNVTIIFFLISLILHNTTDMRSMLASARNKDSKNSSANV